MKRLKIITLILILIIIIQGLWRNTMDLEYIYSMEKNIGILNSHIKPYERDVLHLVYSRLKNMEDNRISKEDPVINTDEQNLRIHFNSQLNKLTNKYLLGDEIILDEDTEDLVQDDLRIRIISNALDVVNESDKEELQRAADLYMESRRTFYIESMAELLRPYENVDTNLFIRQLQDPIDIQGFFYIGEQLQYRDSEPSVTTFLNTEELPLYEELWSEITRIIPSTLTNSIDGLVIYSGMKGRNQPYIRQGEMGDFNLYLNKDRIFTSEGLSPDFYEEVLTEIAFLITTREGQAEYRERPSLTRFFQNGMLATFDSYLNQFYIRYWQDLQKDASISRGLRFSEGTYLFYLRHENQFVSYDAAYGPLEDFAESFSAFVLQEKPLGNEIWEQKIRFFYEFSEFSTIRNSIRRNLEN